MITQNELDQCFTMSDVVRFLHYPDNSRYRNKIRTYIQNNNLSIAHFGKIPHNKKYQVIVKQCPICGKEFQARYSHPKEQYTCSRGCANSFFKSGTNHPNYRASSRTAHRVICFQHQAKICIVCGESNVVYVHHYDYNHDNNDATNLIPLCPTHHAYMHSRHRYIIDDQVQQYHRKLVSP